MVWQENDGTSPNPGIQYSRWNGDTWSTPFKVSENTAFAEIPSIAVSADNTVYVAWTDESYEENGFRRVVYKTRTSSGTWSSVQSLPVPAGYDTQHLGNVAISGTTPHIVFTSNTNSNQDSIFWTQNTGSWSTPVMVSTNVAGDQLTDVQWSDLASDSSGNLHLVYWSGQGIFYRSYNGSVWSTPTLITNSPNLQFPRIAVTPNNEVYVVWGEVNDTSVRARWTVSGVWQPEQILSSNASTPIFASGIIGVTTDSKNRAHAGWGETDENGKIDIKYRTYTGGSWQAAQDADVNNEDAMMPFVYPDLWDNQHFAWSEKNPVSGKWEIKYRVAEGTVQSVGTAGGTVTVNPGGVTQATLTFPNGALSTTQQITALIGPVPESVDPLQITIPRAFTFGPSGLTFPTNVTATIFYTDAEVQGADEAQLKPWFWNSLTSSWEAQTGSVNTGQNRITVDLTHFSLYGISAPLIDFQGFDLPPEETSKRNVKFSFKLAYKDGTDIAPRQNPEDFTVIVKNSSDEIVQTLYLKDGFKKSHELGVYNGKVKLPENGTYTFQVTLNGNVLGEETVTLNK
jgi:hypothetical protein